MVFAHSLCSSVELQFQFVWVNFQQLCAVVDTMLAGSLKKQCDSYFNRLILIV